MPLRESILKRKRMPFENCPAGRVRRKVLAEDRALWTAQILLEEELPVQVCAVNRIAIDNGDLTATFTSQALTNLAVYPSSANKKCLGIRKSFLAEAGGSFLAVGYGMSAMPFCIDAGPADAACPI
jgi:hypothetical protein